MNINSMNYGYTRTKEQWITDLNSDMMSFFCREDLEHALSSYMNARPDSKEFRKTELERMCLARGIDMSELMSDPGILFGVPTREDMKRNLADAFYSSYNDFYQPGDYMERLVRRLAPEYKTDTVRLAILKKFIRGAGFCWKKGTKYKNRYKTQLIIDWALEKFSGDERRFYDKQSDREKLKRIADKLDDGIFSDEYMKREWDDFSTLIFLVDNMIEWICRGEVKEKEESKEELIEAKDITLSSDTMDRIHDFCDSHGLGGSSENNVDCLKRIRDAYRSGKLPKNTANDDIQSFYPQFVRETKVFAKNSYCVTKKGNKVTLKARLDQKEKDQKDQESKERELLWLCDDYAGGSFRNNGGKTRIYLYYFAFMFGMTWHDRGDASRNSDRDLEKNLFEDYYSDDLFRYLSEKYVNNTGYESEPRGDGINYKNYAEMCYLYYLCRGGSLSSGEEQTDGAGIPALSPGELINRAETLIVRCSREAAGKTDKGDVDKGMSDPTGRYTEFYRKDFTEKFIGLEEEELLGFIMENYYVPANSNGGSYARVAFEENSAGETAEYLISVLDEYYSLSDDGISDKDIKKELMTEGIIAEETIAAEDIEDDREDSGPPPYWIFGRELKAGCKHDEKFRNIVNKLGERMSHPEKRLSKGTNLITRNTFVSLCMSEYIESCKEDDVRFETFPELYEDFTDDINKKLEEARFQLFNVKNLTDFYVLLSLYFYTVENGMSFIEE